MKLLDRYLINEIVGPFILALLVIIMLMVSGVLFELSELLITKKVPLLIISQLFSYQLPWAMVEALPIALLVGGLYALGRMSAANELTIIRSLGVSLKRHLAPIFIFAFLISLLSFYISEEVVPRANHAFQNTVRRIVLKEAGPGIEQDVFFRVGKEYFFYIGQVEQTDLEMKNILLYQLRGEEYPRIITASTGYINQGVWHLSDGVMRDIQADGFVSNEIKFSQLQLELGDGLERFFANQKTTREMTRKELAANIRLFGSSGINIKPFLVDYHLKLASPLASLAFAFFCLPLALRFLRLPKSSRSFSIGVCVALTLSYYLLTPFCRSLGINGILPPLYGAWLPTLLFAVLGLLFFLRVDSL